MIGRPEAKLLNVARLMLSWRTPPEPPIHPLIVNRVLGFTGMMIVPNTENTAKSFHKKKKKQKNKKTRISY
jgi:hypothetical protein